MNYKRWTFDGYNAFDSQLASTRQPPTDYYLAGVVDQLAVVRAVQVYFINVGCFDDDRYETNTFMDTTCARAKADCKNVPFSLLFSRCFSRSLVIVVVPQGRVCTRGSLRNRVQKRERVS